MSRSKTMSCNNLILLGTIQQNKIEDKPCILTRSEVNDKKNYIGNYQMEVEVSCIFLLYNRYL